MIKKQDGQLIVYFLIIMMCIAILGLTYFDQRIKMMQREIRVRYVNELFYECDNNLADLRVVQAQVETGEHSPKDTLMLRNKALKNFIKVYFKVFKPSGPNRIKWQEFQKIYKEFGFLEEANGAEIAAAEALVLADFFREVEIWLTKAKGSNYDFEF